MRRKGLRNYGSAQDSYYHSLLILRWIWDEIWTRIRQMITALLLDTCEAIGLIFILIVSILCLCFTSSSFLNIALFNVIITMSLMYISCQTLSLLSLLHLQIKNTVHWYIRSHCVSKACINDAFMNRWHDSVFKPNCNVHQMTLLTLIVIDNWQGKEVNLNIEHKNIDIKKNKIEKSSLIRFWYWFSLN